MEDLDNLYKSRFSEQERLAKDRIWEVLCTDFFQRFVPQGGTTLDLACGYGEFSRHIKAARKLAVDLNPAVTRFLPEGVEFHQSSAAHLPVFEDQSVDLCFTSNFFEHLPSKDVMDQVLKEVLRILVPGGTFMAMQPNIKYAGDSYWDFYDHYLPLSHLSAREGFEKNGYVVDLLIPRFVPFSTKSAYPKHPALVRLYLKLPWVWKLLGKQFVIVAKKPVRG